MKTKFYTFCQINSGGSFDYNEKDGISVHVIIEAISSVEANEIAGNIGIYFNGCDDGIDCECCGDRWYEADECGGKECPQVYGKEVKEHSKIPEEGKKWVEGYDVFIHYKNGKIIGTCK